MSLPTRAELDAEVDAQFAEQFPDAPARLDDDDPAHASWVQAWLAIRDRILNDWVDAVFHRYFPDAGRLDPGDPSDQQLIEYWKDIRDQIRDGATGQWAWDDNPGRGVLHVEHDPAGGWLVRFDRSTTPDEAVAFLWTGGQPDGVQVTAVTDDQVHLGGLTIQAVQTMVPEVSGQIQPGILTADPPGDTGSGGGSGGSGDSGGADVDVELDPDMEEQIKHWADEIIHGTHAIGSTAEVAAWLAENAELGAEAAGAASKAAYLAKAARVLTAISVVGDVLFIVWVGFEVIDAFRSERRSSYRQGFVYGVMWEALGEPDHLPEFADGITYSAQEHKDAFVEGIAAGRIKGRETEVRNRLILAVGALGISSGLGDFYAANEVLSQIWRAARESSPGDSDTDTIRWPVPYDRNQLIPDRPLNTIVRISGRAWASAAPVAWMRG